MIAYSKFFKAALKNLRPEAEWSLVGGSFEKLVDPESGEVSYPNFTWMSQSVSIPSEEEILAEIQRLEDVYETNEYQRLRKPEYPPLADLADALFWQSQGDESKMTAYLAAVEAVKQKYPKGV